MRKNVAEDKVILKYTTLYPDALEGLGISGLDHAGALTETQKVAWERVSDV